MNLNLSASLNIFKLIARPSLCLPHATVATFNDLPIPLNQLFSKPSAKAVDIRAVVLDKDDCFAYPEQSDVYDAYKVQPLPLPPMCDSLFSNTILAFLVPFPNSAIVSLFVLHTRD